MSETSSPAVSVVAVLWNSDGELPGFLESIYSPPPSVSVEVILVDNGSAVHPGPIIAGRSGVTLIENRRNVGFAPAINRGIAHARGRHLLLANPDIVFRPGALDALVEHLDRSPRAGGVGPRIEVRGGTAAYPLPAVDPGLCYGFAYFSGLLTRFPRSRLFAGQIAADSPAGPLTVPWLHGCCALYRREALASAGGGYDERYFLYFEDADLGRAMRARGWELHVLPAARVEHQEERSTRRAGLAPRRHFLESWHKYHRKHSGIALRAAAWTSVLAALSAQWGWQGLRRSLALEHRQREMNAYLRAHLRNPFRDLEGERRVELDALRATWGAADAGALPVATATPETVPAHRS